MRKGQVRIENGKFYDCYLEDRHWNGWACPWFTEEIADTICKDINADLTNPSKFNKDCGRGLTGFYLPIYTEYDFCGEGSYIYKAETFEIGGQTVTLVPLGNSVWIWSEE